MTERKSVILHNAQQGAVAFNELREWCKAMLLAGHALTVTAKPRSRSDEASAKFHAMCGDFAKSGIPWAGKPRTAIQWKVLLISGHSVATKDGAEMVPGLESEFVNIRESSAQMSGRRMASLIEYTQAMGSHMGIKFSAPDA